MPIARKSASLAVSQRKPESLLGAQALLRGDDRSVNPFESTIERLGSAIKMGLLVGGDQLPPERELAALMGVSRLTLRAALKGLESGGFIESRRGRGGGTFVARTVPTLTPTQLAEVRVERAVLEDWIAQRHVIETGVAELAARNATETHIEQLRKLNALMRDTEHALREYRPLDTLFHIALAQATASRGLEAWMAQTHARLSGLMQHIPSTKGALSHSTNYHDRIVDAIVARDAEAARGVMALHVEATASMLRGLLPKPGAGKRAPVAGDAA
ncbi:FadR/GntR family transcriptional regulator [Derxia gummosa]|uniref:FadR/GntR family transcriptional regulator n=1 Tax=Derxia gummosa DSM 723 TaxID=1121388 RepID=A0A8B6X9J6_9BURK|nr:FCD domain-containing protein [Derxia gummosa]